MAVIVAITGANGFVGRHLVRLLRHQGMEPRGVVRSADAARVVEEAGGRAALAPGLDQGPLAAAFAGARAVVHLAQIGSEKPGGPSFEDVNVGGTRAVAAAARAAGARRLVLFSGLGVARYGLARHTTNRYFLSKLGAEREVFLSGLEAVAFRPSYVVGPGDELTASLLAQMEAGRVEQVGDGAYRLQPVAVEDAAAAAFRAALDGGLFPGPEPHRVIDLVGPEPVRFDDFLGRFRRAAGALGKGGEYRIGTVPPEEAFRRARAEGFHGMRPESLDCLLSDEVSDPAPLGALLGRPLTALDEGVRRALV